MTDAARHDEMVLSAREVFTAMSKLRGDVLAHDLMSGAMMLGAVRLGDLLARADLGRPDVPLLQFARHFRNACAHGDRWHFRGDEPRFPAACRDLVLSAELHGRRATWETVSPRRFVEFLDDLSSHFAPGLGPAPA